MPDLATLAQAQAFLQDSTTNGVDWVQMCLDAGSDAVIEFLGGDPTSQVRTEVIDGTNTMFIYPDYRGKPAPITGVTSIEVAPAMTGGWGGDVGWLSSPVAPITVDLTQIGFLPDSIFYTLPRVFPRGKRNLTVVYTSGYATLGQTIAGVAPLPNAVVTATLFAAKAIYTTLGKEMNASSESYSGVFSQSFTGGGPGGLPPAAQLLLKPYRTLMKN
jgi:hypothetical protein